MTLEALKQAEQRTVGVKQTEKAVLKGIVEAVYIANDADERVTANLQRLCREMEVPVIEDGNMMLLGRACGIKVKAAAAAILLHQ